MKVKELIEELSKLDPEMGVLYYEYDKYKGDEYLEGENFAFGVKRMVEFRKYRSDKLIEVNYQPYEDYKDELSLEDGKEFLILNSENDED